MSLLNNLSNWCANHANALINAFPISSEPIIIFIFFILLNTYLSTSKLQIFNKPNKPKLSLILREVAFTLHVCSKILIIATFIYLFTIFILAYFAYYLSENLASNGSLNIIFFTLKQVWAAMHPILPSLVSGSLFGVSSGVYLKYFLIPDLEKGEGLDDVNDIASAFKKLHGFDPRPYINLEKGCFIGKSTDNKLIYIPWKKLRETHIQVIGTTGSGKGVIMSLIAYQSILAGETLTWFDPKFDRFAHRILADAAKIAKKDFYLINLNPDQPPQINPLAGATAYEIEELLVAAFDLKGKGTDGDFYRGKDEDAAILASKIAIAENALSIPELIKACRSIEEITNQENFWRQLKKLGDLDVINTNSGLNLEKAILSGAVICFIGSTDKERVRMLQKLMLVRVFQITKKQDRFQNLVPNCIGLEEFKYMLSSTALTGLSVSRDFNVHCLLAHQSLGDLDSCAGITRAEAEGAVLDNTAIKIVYRIGDSGYAEKLSKNSGKKRIFVEQTGKSLDKNNQQQGGWKETNTPLIDTDLITHLPMPSDREGQACVGVVFGVGVSKVFYTGHIPTSSEMPRVKAAPKFRADPTLDGENDDDLI